jgi:hypothetical protein
MVGDRVRDSVMYFRDGEDVGESASASVIVGEEKEVALTERK